MSFGKPILKFSCVLLVTLGFAWGCGFDATLREYLSTHFWLPLAKGPALFEKPGVRRADAPFAGMMADVGDGPLGKLRSEYQTTAQEEAFPSGPAAFEPLLANARADRALTGREREEVDLIDAKVDLRAGRPQEPELLLRAQKKLERLLRTAQTPEYRSEARGWLGRVHYLLGHQAVAGKIYLDELNRNGSNLSRETLFDSLRLNYGYDGGTKLLSELEEYFDTPEHAAFAIQLVTNPHRTATRRPGSLSRADTRIRDLLDKHRDLFQSNRGADTLALLGMRTALRAGDPPAVLKIAAAIPNTAAVRSEPDFHWMFAAAQFLSRQYAAAEGPLLALFGSRRSSPNQKAAAAYGLCGVYRKLGRPLEQLRFALWLRSEGPLDRRWAFMSGLSDVSVYWAISGWDLNLLLETEAPIEVLQSFVEQYPDLQQIRLVKYALAVRLTRENRYNEAADLYQSIHAVRRAPRVRRLAALYHEATRSDLGDREKHEARYRLAEFLSANGNGVYYNDALWGGLQNYAFQASTDYRLTRAEREAMMQGERKLKDDQEEYWRAYLILRDVVHDTGETELGRKAALLAVRCLRRISGRFDRQGEIRRADTELTNWLQRVRKASPRGD